MSFEIDLIESVTTSDLWYLDLYRFISAYPSHICLSIVNTVSIMDNVTRETMVITRW